MLVSVKRQHEAAIGYTYAPSLQSLPPTSNPVYFIFFFLMLIFIYVFIWLCQVLVALWDLGSMTRDGAHAPCTQSAES